MTIRTLADVPLKTGVVPLEAGVLSRGRLNSCDPTVCLGPVVEATTENIGRSGGRPRERLCPWVLPESLLMRAQSLRVTYLKDDGHGVVYKILLHLQPLSLSKTSRGTDR